MEISVPHLPRNSFFLSVESSHKSELHPSVIGLYITKQMLIYQKKVTAYTQHSFLVPFFVDSNKKMTGTNIKIIKTIDK